jgi:hypothetical protein
VNRPGAVVLPHPVLLVPQLTGPGPVAASALRAACAAAVRSLLDPQPSVVLMVGAGRVTLRHPDDAWGTLAGYGAAVSAPLPRPGAGDTPAELPLSLTVGRWLLDTVGYPGPVLMQQVALDEPADGCARLGADLAAELAHSHGDGVWLVLGDLSTMRTDRAPGAFDLRAESFDAQVERALAAGDPRQVLELDAALAAQLGVAGLSALKVLAGGWASRSGRAEATIDYADAPYGVGYVVARWTDG